MCDAYTSISAEFGGIRDSCLDIYHLIFDIKIVPRNGRNLSRSLLEREGEMGPWGLVARWHALRVRSHPDWVLALSPSAHSPLLPESADRKYRLKGGSQVA